MSKLVTLEVEGVVPDEKEFKRLVRNQAKAFGGRVIKWMLNEGSYNGKNESDRSHRAKVVVTHVIYKSWDIDAGCWVISVNGEEEEFYL